MSEVRKISALLPVSSELYELATRESALLKMAMGMTPEEREANREMTRRKRAEERASSAEREVTISALLGKLNWTEQYARHFVQPYCYCEDGMDGWEFCEHARDEGLTGY